MHTVRQCYPFRRCFPNVWQSAMASQCRHRSMPSGGSGGGAPGKGCGMVQGFRMASPCKARGLANSWARNM